MSVLLLPPIFQFFDDNGDPLAGGFVDTYAAGTTTRLATFTDYTGTVAAPNPIRLDPAGRPESGSGAIWGEGAYKFIVKNSAGVQVGNPLDNVTSFNTLANSASAYFQSFSGNGTQTVFTTTDDLGTEEKALMVFVAKGLQEQAVNGSFTTDTDWTKGAGWTIAAGVATATGAISTALSQVPTIPLVAGQAYAITYTITRSAGGLIPSLGGQAGVERTVSGTYREVIIAAATTPTAFTGNAFTGTLDNVSITRVDAQGYDIINPSAYTISGTSLTFATAPATGTGNIYVFAPSLLLGAASSAAALAQLYAANALASEVAAAASASLAAASIKVKPAVACATTANITLSGEQTIDTVLTSASRVLVKNQSDARLNGVYVSAAGAWSRATDADTWTEIQGQSVFTSGGSVNINKTWANTNEAGGTIGVDNITWTELFTYIADNSVTTAKILNANVTLAKIANAAASSKLLGSGASGSGASYAELTLGTNLSMSGTTLNATSSAAGLTVIGSSTPTGVSQVNFTSIPQTYRGLYLVFNGISCDTASRALQIAHDNGAGMAVASAFPKKILGTTVSAAAGVDMLSVSTSLTAAQTISGFVKIMPYQAITLTPSAIPLREYTAFYYDSLFAAATIAGGLETNGASDVGVTGLRLYWSGSGNFDAGTVTLYGIN